MSMLALASLGAAGGEAADGVGSRAGERIGWTGSSLKISCSWSASMVKRPLLPQHRQTDRLRVNHDGDDVRDDVTLIVLMRIVRNPFWFPAKSITVRF
jgi:hypothetical protein